MYFLNNITWKFKLAPDPWTAERMFKQHENRALEWLGALSVSSNILKGILLFPEHQVWTVGLKFLANHAGNKRIVIQALWFHLQSTSGVDLE